jgi:membrane-bound lytic murein transglycosylase B
LNDLLAYWLGKTSNSFSDWQLMLYSNSLTPSQSTVFADLTEATFGGYSRITLGKSTWQSPAVTLGKSRSTYGTDPLMWIVASGSETIYGYAMITPSSPVIRAIEAFDTPFTVTPGGVLTLIPKMTFTTDPSP